MTEQYIRKTWITGKNSTTLVIPKELAHEFDLSQFPSYVVLEKTKDGILVRKLDMEKL